MECIFRYGFKNKTLMFRNLKKDKTLNGNKFIWVVISHFGIFNIQFIKSFFAIISSRLSSLLVPAF